MATAKLGGLWTTVASARKLHREQLMREIANRESTLPPLDRLVAARGNRRQGIWATLARPCFHGIATWLRPGFPARIALSKEVESSFSRN